MTRAQKDERIPRLLKQVGLAGDADKPIGQYSKGMQQRIGLAQCLLNDPKILILDEPTGGLDPGAHIDIRDLILGLRGEGKTIFISSHDLSDVERICDRVAIINEGKVQLEGNLDALLGGDRVEVEANGVGDDLQDKLKAAGTITTLTSGRLIMDVADDGTVNGVVDLLRSKQASIVSIVARRRRLEDLFVETVSAATDGSKA